MVNTSSSWVCYLARIGPTLEAAQMRLRLPHHSRRVFSAMHLTCMGPSTAPVPRGAFLQTGQACQRVIGQWPLLVQHGFARQRWLLRPRG
jgi:hypothetical protein